MECVEICEMGEKHIYTAPGGAERLLMQWEHFRDAYESDDYKKMLRMMMYTYGTCVIVDMLMGREIEITERKFKR